MTVPERDAFLPTVTFPKLILDVIEPKVPGDVVSWPPALTPWQPTKKARPAESRTTPVAFLRCFK